VEKLMVDRKQRVGMHALVSFLLFLFYFYLSLILWYVQLTPYLIIFGNVVTDTSRVVLY
jgi:hypothetical protein